MSSRERKAPLGLWVSRVLVDQWEHQATLAVTVWLALKAWRDLADLKVNGALKEEMVLPEFQGFLAIQEQTANREARASLVPTALRANQDQQVLRVRQDHQGRRARRASRVLKVRRESKVLLVNRGRMVRLVPQVQTVSEVVLERTAKRANNKVLKVQTASLGLLENQDHKAILESRGNRSGCVTTLEYLFSKTAFHSCDSDILMMHMCTGISLRTVLFPNRLL